MSASPDSHFTTGGADYAAFRPQWPDALARTVAALAPGHALAVDVGCGTGQLTGSLARQFGRVIGFDVAPGQLAAAVRRANILYAAARAEALPLASGSVAALTVGQAVHWFDLPAFYAEARRVAQPGAVLALATYGAPRLEGPLAPQLAALRRAIAPFWPAERALVEDGYRDLHFPFARLPVPAMVIEAQWPLPRLLGYVETWSATRRARAAGQGAAADQFAAVARAMPGGAQARLALRFPVSVLATRLG